MSDEHKYPKGDNPIQGSEESDKTLALETNDSTEVKKEWIDHWLVQAILITLYFKIFGVLGGLCGLGSFYYLKKKQSAIISIVISSVIGFVSWAIAYALIRSNV
jgi:hypothetical protein